MRSRRCRRCSPATPTRRPRRRGRFSATGTPVVVKIMSRDIVHKSDIGGVRLDLASEGCGARRRRPRSIARAHAASARRPHPGRDRPADDRAAQGPRAHRRHRRRSDVRPGHRLRRRRNGGRGARRQGAGAAAARPQDGERADRTHADFAHTQGLSRRARGQDRGCRLDPGQARPARGRRSGGARPRHQPAARRRARRARPRRPHRGRPARGGAEVQRARLQPIRRAALSEGMGAASRASRRHEGVRPAGAARGRGHAARVSRAGSPPRICGFASSPRSAISATPSCRG